MTKTSAGFAQNFYTDVDCARAASNIKHVFYFSNFARKVKLISLINDVFGLLLGVGDYKLMMCVCVRGVCCCSVTDNYVGVG